MMRWFTLDAAYIRITRIPYEEPYHLHLGFDVSNGRQRWSFDYYDNTTALLEWADALEVFPRHVNDVFLYEVGSERAEDHWGCHFRLHVFTVGSTGHCAIQFRFNNNQELPEREVFEFCIGAEPSQLNNLARLLRHFAKLGHEVLEWWVSDGCLHEHAPTA
jgi:hypothetical protein